MRLQPISDVSTIDTGPMIEVGDSVRTVNGEFSGRVLGRHGAANGVGGAFEYRSLPDDLNLAVYAVLNTDTGEVRYFVRTALAPIGPA